MEEISGPHLTLEVAFKRFYYPKWIESFSAQAHDEKMQISRWDDDTRTIQTWIIFNGLCLLCRVDRVGGTTYLFPLF